MPASNPLSSTQFAVPVGRFDSQVKLVSTTGLTAGMRLFVEMEFIAVVSLAGYANLVNVRRGIDGTAAERHGTDVAVWVGTADRFYESDPMGQPAVALIVSPHINIKTGGVFFAQGDASTNGTRYWVKQTIGHDTAALGFTPAVPSPTSST